MATDQRQNYLEGNVTIQVQMSPGIVAASFSVRQKTTNRRLAEYVYADGTQG